VNTLPEALHSEIAKKKGYDKSSFNPIITNGLPYFESKDVPRHQTLLKNVLSPKRRIDNLMRKIPTLVKKYTNDEDNPKVLGLDDLDDDFDHTTTLLSLLTSHYNNLKEREGNFSIDPPNWSVSFYFPPLTYLGCVQ
jgi:hypothetical protein